MIQTCSETHYGVTGETDDIPQAVSDALMARAGEEDWSCEITLWGPFGYRLHGDFGFAGICTYKATKTGYDGDFRVEGRGYTNDAMAVLRGFFKA